MLWTNDSLTALNKRSWTAARLVASATEQIRKGGYGMIYVTCTEDARASVANRRVARLGESLQQWTLDAKVRIPL